MSVSAHTQPTESGNIPLGFGVAAALAILMGMYLWANNRGTRR